MEGNSNAEGLKIGVKEGIKKQGKMLEERKLRKSERRLGRKKKDGFRKRKR